MPPGTAFQSDADGSKELHFESKQAFIAITAPIRFPTGEKPLGPSDMKASEGLNRAGLSFSLLAYPTSAPDKAAGEVTKALLDASDLGTWILSQFGSVDEVKRGLAEQPVHLTRLALVGNVTFPFHIVVNDKSGGSIVIEWHHGQEKIYANPVGVMTNGPDFRWHLTNLRNWTHLTDVNSSSGNFGDLEGTQPDPGIGGDEKSPPTEYTSWTNLSDPGRSQFLLRTYASFNYTRFDLAKLSESDQVHLLPTAGLDALGGDGTEALLAAKLPGT